MLVELVVVVVRDTEMQDGIKLQNQFGKNKKNNIKSKMLAYF